MKSSPQNWKNYEDLARHVISHFADILGISTVEAKQRLQGQSGTEWEVDAKGVCSEGKGFLVIECKQRSASRLNQGDVAKLAFTVEDVGAASGVLVTTIGLQRGAEELARKCDFHLVYIPKESTLEDFVAWCGNRVLRKLPPERATMSISLSGFYCSAVGDQKKPEA